MVLLLINFMVHTVEQSEPGLSKFLYGSHIFSSTIRRGFDCRWQEAYQVFCLLLSDTVSTGPLMHRQSMAALDVTFATDLTGKQRHGSTRN